MPVYQIPQSPPAIVIIQNDGKPDPHRKGEIMLNPNTHREGINLIPWCPVGYLPDRPAVHVALGDVDYPDKIYNIIANAKCVKSKIVRSK